MAKGHFRRRAVDLAYGEVACQVGSVDDRFARWHGDASVLVESTDDGVRLHISRSDPNGLAWASAVISMAQLGRLLDALRSAAGACVARDLEHLRSIEGKPDHE